MVFRCVTDHVKTHDVHGLGVISAGFKDLLAHCDLAEISQPTAGQWERGHQLSLCGISTTHTELLSKTVVSGTVQTKERG